jgi:hypothetical protein
VLPYDIDTQYLTLCPCLWGVSGVILQLQYLDLHFCVIGEDQRSDLAVEEQGNLGETLKGPETVTSFCQKDYTSQHLGGTGTTSFLRSMYWEKKSRVRYFADCMELFRAECEVVSHGWLLIIKSICTWQAQTLLGHKCLHIFVLWW